MSSRSGGLSFDAVYSRLPLSEPRRSFAPVLGTIILTVIFQLATPDGDLARLIGVVLQGSVILLALRAAGFSHHVIGVARVALTAVVIAAVVAVFGPQDGGQTVPRVLTLLLIMLTPLAVVAGVVRELRDDRRVTVQTIICGLCLYLLLGMAFAFVFGAIEDISREPFFNAGVPGSPNDFLYFSLSTLTTTGYGDFSAQTELGRAVAVTEALVGQMYLVTVLAVIVSNVGSSRVGKR